MRKLFQNIIIGSVLTIMLAASSGLIGGNQAHAQTSTPTTINQQQAPSSQTTSSTSTTTATQAGGQVEEPSVSCESSFVGLGWLLCQVTRGIYGVFNYLVTEVLAERLLEIDFSDSREDLMQVWDGFRTLANLIFVILFLVIIYAEASGRIAMLETYSLTRILPRLFVAVIGIQLSFFVVSYLIEFFNDMGRGVADVMLAPLGGFSDFEFANGDDGTWFGLPVTGVGEDFIDNLIAVPVVYAIGIAALFLIPSVLSFGALGLLVLLLTLIARKIIIIGLIVLGPIAFACFALPGTEKIFKLWWDTLTKALMMYPFIMIFIASGQLLGKLAIAGENVTFIDSMIGMIATFLPLFMIPITFRLAGNAIGGIVGGLNNASEKMKGDIKDPNSMRSRMRRNRLQRYGRALGPDGSMRTPNSRFMPGAIRNKSVVPAFARNGYNRLPGTNTMTGMMQDIEWGRKVVAQASSTIGDDVYRAATVTGGGRLKGYKVNTADGGRVWSGRAKLGKHMGYNADGTIMTNAAGVAQVLNKRTGQYGDAKTSDFYDQSVMGEVYKYGGNRGFIAASNEYTMTKSNMDERDESQVWRGLNATKFTADEKTGMAQGIWYNTKDAALHNKFGNFGEMFKDGAYDHIKEANKAGDSNIATRGMKLKFQDLTEYVHKQTEQYPATNLKHTFWRAVNDNMGDFVQTNNITRNMSAVDFNAAAGNDQLGVELKNIAWKAKGIINQNRTSYGGAGQTTHVDSDGNPQTMSSGSGASGASAEEALRFLKSYRQHIGDLPFSDVDF